MGHGGHLATFQFIFSGRSNAKHFLALLFRCQPAKWTRQTWGCEFSLAINYSIWFCSVSCAKILKIWCLSASSVERRFDGCVTMGLSLLLSLLEYTPAKSWRNPRMPPKHSLIKSSLITTTKASLIAFKTTLWSKVIREKFFGLIASRFLVISTPLNILLWINLRLHEAAKCATPTTDTKDIFPVIMF